MEDDNVKTTGKKFRNLMEDDNVKTTGKKFRNLMEDDYVKEVKKRAPIDKEFLKEFVAPTTTIAGSGIAAAALGDKSRNDRKEAEIERRQDKNEMQRETRGMKSGGMVKSSASKRADGIAKKGKTRGRMV